MKYLLPHTVDYYTWYHSLSLLTAHGYRSVFRIHPCFPKVILYKQLCVCFPFYWVLGHLFVRIWQEPMSLFLPKLENVVFVSSLGVTWLFLGVMCREGSVLVSESYFYTHCFHLPVQWFSHYNTCKSCLGCLLKCSMDPPLEILVQKHWCRT